MRSAECIGCNAGLMCIGGVCAFEPVDAGLLDAGSFQMDGGDSGVVNPDGGLPRVGLGCSCRPGGRSPSSASVLLTGLGGVLLVLVSRRRHAR